MKQPVTISSGSTVRGTVKHLPASKSLSNRALVIRALMDGSENIENLSTANDTRLMKHLLHTQDEVINAEDAGTVMRFLTAYYAVTGQKKVITGTPRMQQRPIRELVDALRKLGSSIAYEAAEGYPPVRLNGFPAQATDALTIRGDVSSQFISAIMMVAPTLPRGLTLSLTGRVGSRPYMEMTGALMSHYGVHPTLDGNTIRIPAGKYQPRAYRVEPDWSAASYWFAIAALAREADLLLPHVTPDSLQGDRIIADIMIKLGVRPSFEPAGLRLTGGGPTVPHLKMDFSDCPDLAQTILPVMAVLGIPGEFTGMESLRIKETDRVLALQGELTKLGASLSGSGDGWVLQPCERDRPLPARVQIATYEDHRMAMGFAPLATRTQVSFDDRSVVRKSYPDFWEDLEAVGFRIS